MHLQSGRAGSPVLGLPHREDTGEELAPWACWWDIGEDAGGGGKQNPLGGGDGDPRRSSPWDPVGEVEASGGWGCSRCCGFSEEGEAAHSGIGEELNGAGSKEADP
jgi:hypothetical protein